MMTARKQRPDPVPTPTTPARVMTLSLVIEYDEVNFADAVEAAKDIIEKAREYGSVKMARLDNLPDSIDMRAS